MPRRVCFPMGAFGSPTLKMTVFLSYNCCCCQYNCSKDTNQVWCASLSLGFGERSTPLPRWRDQSASKCSRLSWPGHSREVDMTNKYIVDRYVIHPQSDKYKIKINLCQEQEATAQVGEKNHWEIRSSPNYWTKERLGGISPLPITIWFSSCCSSQASRQSFTFHGEGCFKILNCGFCFNLEWNKSKVISF